MGSLLGGSRNLLNLGGSVGSVGMPQDLSKGRKAKRRRVNPSSNLIKWHVCLVVETSSLLRGGMMMHVHPNKRMQLGGGRRPLMVA